MDLKVFESYYYVPKGQYSFQHAKGTKGYFFSQKESKMEVFNSFPLKIFLFQKSHRQNLFRST